MTLLNKNLSTKQVQQQYVPLSLMTIRRLSKDPKSGFPKPHTVGRSVYLNESDILLFLSKKTGFKVDSSDRVITANELLELFNKSYTWLWQHVKKGNIPKPFYINRSRFWMQSQIDSFMDERQVGEK